MGIPLKRYDSQSCVMWHKPNNTRISSDSPMYNTCSMCKGLTNELKAIKHRAEATSPSVKEMWKESSSNRPIKFLSPSSQATRHTNNVKERYKLKKCHKIGCGYGD